MTGGRQDITEQGSEHNPPNADSTQLRLQARVAVLTLVETSNASVSQEEKGQGLVGPSRKGEELGSKNPTHAKDCQFFC